MDGRECPCSVLFVAINAMYNLIQRNATSTINDRGFFHVLVCIEQEANGIHHDDVNMFMYNRDIPFTILPAVYVFLRRVVWGYRVWGVDRQTKTDTLQL